MRLSQPIIGCGGSKTTDEMKEFTMNITRINFIIDLPLMALTILEGISGILLLIGANDATYLEISGFEWKNIHEVIGITMIVSFVIHFVLYWKWIIDETIHADLNIY